MPRVLMHKWALTPDGKGPGELVAENVLVQVDESEEARFGAVKELLGGAVDGVHEREDGARLFRRLDPTAPGGVGWMVSGQLLPDAN